MSAAGRGRQRRETYTAVLAAYGLTRKRARLWQAVAEACPHLDEYLVHVAERGRELSLRGLVAVARPQREKVPPSMWVSLLALGDAIIELASQTAEEVDAGHGTATGIPAWDEAAKNLGELENRVVTGLAELGGAVERIEARQNTGPAL